jgi:hypothetical protein
MEAGTFCVCADTTAGGDAIHPAIEIARKRTATTAARFFITDLKIFWTEKFSIIACVRSLLGKRRYIYYT